MWFGLLCYELVSLPTMTLPHTKTLPYISMTFNLRPTFYLRHAVKFPKTSSTTLVDRKSCRVKVGLYSSKTDIFLFFYFNTLITLNI